MSPSLFVVGRKMEIKQSAFTLVEMMVVLSIIAILALMATPSMEYKTSRIQVVESVELLKSLKETVSEFYLEQKHFPLDNLEAGIPRPEKLVGNYVQEIELVNGVFNIKFGNKATKHLQNNVLSIQPVVVKDSPDSPISWVCGGSQVPINMMAMGKNITNIQSPYLPLNCF